MTTFQKFSPFWIDTNVLTGVVPSLSEKWLSWFCAYEITFT